MNDFALTGLLLLFFGVLIVFLFYLFNLVTQRMDQLGQQVQSQLSENVEKTVLTFGDVLKRLALIDSAQEKMTMLSGQVMNLNMILNDRKTRGAFGEVQLENIIRNMLPEPHFTFQAALPNQTRVDCLLNLPPPTGRLAIDAKFPLENYRRFAEAPRADQKQFEQAFIRDMKRHIEEIATKYIIPGYTAAGAILFLPAEAIFADLHSHFYDVIDFAHQHAVWITSPTTLMAVLTTAQAVLKDQATREHVHIIREHLKKLSEDFQRFQKRMEGVQRHAEQTLEGIEQVHISARKIWEQFEKVEKVELTETHPNQET